jgi:16S rRNA U516 pseudouridylate synthase RsuA-like enzyme
MIEAVGGRVRRLRRVREGPLWLGDLGEGVVRRLTPAEVKALQSSSPPNGRTLRERRQR